MLDDPILDWISYHGVSIDNLSKYNKINQVDDSIDDVDDDVDDVDDVDIIDVDEDDYEEINEDSEVEDSEADSEEEDSEEEDSEEEDSEEEDSEEEESEEDENEQSKKKILFENKFFNFLLNNGKLFEDGIMNIYKNKFKKNEIIQIANNQKDIRKYSKFMETIDAMKNGVPLIYQGVIHDIDSKRYGVLIL